MIKKVLAIVAVVIGAYFYHSQSNVEITNLPTLASYSGERTQSFEVDDLFDSRIRLNQLAEEGFYTIVEVYSDECATCRKIESKFPALLKAREDIIIRRVRLFSGAISFSTVEESQKWRAKQNAMQDFYGYYGTPHIEIYDEKGEVIVKDEGRRKPGLQMLKQWLGLS